MILMMLLSEPMKEMLVCDKAAYGGANAFTPYQLQNINKTVLLSCLEDFGRYEIEGKRAEVQNLFGIKVDLIYLGDDEMAIVAK